MGIHVVFQSSVLDDVLYTDRPMVVSAPTGCGKTVIFELAMVRLLRMSEGLGVEVCIGHFLQTISELNLRMGFPLTRYRFFLPFAMLMGRLFCFLLL